jgi:S1-C subfamily serine protease
VYKKTHNAVVTINSESVLTPTAAPAIPTPGATTLYKTGNGFFVRDHYIVCPASLVLIPQTLLATNNRYPYVRVNQPAPTGTIQNAMTSVSRILVGVSNVNNGERSYVYEAKLVGVDGAGDVAYLEIDYKSQYNANNPKICKEHPRFKWGESRQLTPGMKIYSYGDFTGLSGAQTGSEGFLSGVLSNNRALYYTGAAEQELLFADFQTFAGKTGLPFIDQFGRVVGMQTLNTESHGVTAGPSEFFMRRALKAFMCPKDKSSSCHLRVIPDNNGSYYAYIKSYLGLTWKTVAPRTYDSAIDPVTGVVSLRVDQKTGTLPNTPACKELVGVQIVAVAGDTTTKYVTIPGAAGTTGSTGSPPLVGTVDSPVLNIIKPQDILTHLDGYAVGNQYHQIAPALLTWRYTAGKVVTLEYRKFSDDFNTKAQTIATAVEYPPVYDYPFYSVTSSQFPDPNFQQPF